MATITINTRKAIVDVDVEPIKVGQHRVEDLILRQYIIKRQYAEHDWVVQILNDPNWDSNEEYVMGGYYLITTTVTIDTWKRLGGAL